MSFVLTPRMTHWLILSLSLVLIPHLPHLPLWIPPLFGALAWWRYRIAQGRARLPPGMLRTGLGVLVMVGILFQFHTIFGRNPGVAFLAGLIGLKLLEAQTRRDVMLTIFLGYFLIITNFFYSQTIALALYLLLVMVVTTATLVTLNDNGGTLSVRYRLKFASTLVAQAVPLMLVAFILFPRIEGGLWRLPGDAASATSGLSDRLSPGSISQLSQSEEIAFRVKIEAGDMPPNDQRYWRGPVFWWSDGKEWRVGFNQFEDPKPLAFSGEPIRQIITLEPHNQVWLFALELPEAAPAEVKQSRLTYDYQLQTRTPLNERIRYRVTSYPHYQMGAALDRTQRDIGLRLPSNKHYRAKALAAQWLAENPDPAKLVERALQHFNQEPFEYTLEPPLLVDDPVDEFLFDTQSGFCEHYATAFTVLMRAAGIPARIVTGYQGAELNQLGNYWIVRQRDAHAWSEVWLAGQGWVRVDPTAAVSPSRVQQGIQSALPESVAQSAALNWTRNQPYLRGAVEHMLNMWDAANNGWNEWVLGYGPELQHALLDYLGMPTTYQAMTMLLVSITGAILVVIVLWLVRSHRHQYTDPAQRAYQGFRRKLARQGLVLREYEAPHAFSRRASRRFPSLAAQIERIANLYLAIRYAGETDKLKALQQAVRRFHV